MTYRVLVRNVSFSWQLVGQEAVVEMLGVSKRAVL
jgi:hypothetical protein